MTPKKDIPYLERLRSELLQSIAQRRERRPAADWWRTRSVVVAAAAAAVIAAGVVSAVVLTGGSSPNAPRTSDRGGAVLSSCVEQFSLESLARRDFAFDGTITEVTPPGDPEAEGTAAAADVVFEVHRWYKGGSGDTITLKTYELPGVISSIEGGPDLSVGSRLLASGDDVFLWSCGFSMPYSEANSQLYGQAFGA